MEGKEWAETASERLEEEGVSGLRRSLREFRQRQRSAAGRKEVRGEVRYFRRNRKRMDYPRYRRAGRRIGSGPVEAAGKSVVGCRLQGTGMRGSRTGAEAMLAVRTASLGQEQDTLSLAARAA